MVGVTRAPRNIAHRIIEEFMLAANEAVAAHLEEHLAASIYRIHEQPDPEARAGIRGSGGALRLLAGRGRDPGEAVCLHDRQRDGGKVRKEMMLPEASIESRRATIRSWWPRSKASRRSGF